MNQPGRHPIGSSFESFLEEDGLLEAVDEAAIKEVIAWQIAEAMKQRNLTKSAMADAMQTSRTQVNRLLDPSNTGVALHTLYRAAAVLGKKLRIEMVDDNGSPRRSRRASLRRRLGHA
jgi:predicted XRE-type DNA-binding protein